MAKIVGYGGWVEIGGQRVPVTRWEAHVEPGWRRWLRVLRRRIRRLLG